MRNPAPPFFCAGTLIASLVLSFSTIAEEKAFPERAHYYSLQWISAAELHARMSNVELVDVRSKYEYETLHIKGARNIILGSGTFMEEVKKLRNESPRPIVFYCNSETCRKSYAAALAAKTAGIGNVFVYDGGIFSWTKQFPQESVLLGESPVSPSKLLGEKKLQAHLLSPDAFEKKIDKRTTIVLDIRDRFQQDGTTLFPAAQRRAPLDNDELRKYVDRAIREKKTLLIFDASGGQVRLLQYYLEAKKVASYYFMEGGTKAYYDQMIGNVLKK